MLNSDMRKTYKAYVKKFEDGFGIKTISTITGIENILVITTDSVLQHSNDLKIESCNQTLNPVCNKLSQENIGVVESITTLPPSNFAISKVLSCLEPYLRELKPNITGFHVFEEDDSVSAHNIQKESIIFVANTKLAKEKGVQFNIPGKLMNLFTIDVKENVDKIKFKADSVVKPLTIIVGDHVLHVHICFDLPPMRTSKTIATQTRKRYVLRSSVNKNTVCNIEPLFHKFIQSECKEIQTETNTSLSESTQTKFDEFSQVCGTQTESVVVCNSSTSTTSLYEANSDKSPFKTQYYEFEEDYFETVGTLIINRSTPLIDSQDSRSTFNTFKSHTQCQHKNSSYNFNDNQFKNNNIDTQCKTNELFSLCSRDTDIHESHQNARNPSENNFISILANSSDFKSEETIIENFQSINNECKYKILSQNKFTKSNNTENNNLSSFYSLKENIDSNSTTNNESVESSTNISIEEIKQHLNEAKLYLQHIYSVVEFLENWSAQTSHKKCTEKMSSMTIDNSFPCELVNSETVPEISEKVTVNISSISSLCECCGSFYSTISSESHECDELYANNQTNFMTSQNDFKNIKKIDISEPIKKKCNNAYCLWDIKPHNELVKYINSSKAFHNTNYTYMPTYKSSKSLMEDNTKSPNLNNICENGRFNIITNQESNKSISKNITNKHKHNKSDIIVKKPDEYLTNKEINYEYNLYNNVIRNIFQNSSEELITILPLTSEHKKIMKSHSVIEDLNIVSSYNNELKFDSYSNSDKVFSGINSAQSSSESVMEKLFKYHKRNKTKSSTVFKMCSKSLNGYNKYKLNKKVVNFEPNTKRFSISPVDKCNREGESYIRTEKDPSCSDIIELLDNKSEENSSNRTLHITPSSYNLQEEEILSNNYIKGFCSSNVKSPTNKVSPSLSENIQNISSKKISCDIREDNKKNSKESQNKKEWSKKRNRRKMFCFII